MFPTPEHGNIVISASGIGGSKGFSALVSNEILNYHTISEGHCLPLYWYQKFDKDKRKDKPQGEMFAGSGKLDESGYICHDAITDWALERFQNQYNNVEISKEDIFWYTYGILHSPEYKSRFATNLKKMVPRIPFAADFEAFRAAGYSLGQLHLNYENSEQYPLTEDANRVVMEDSDYSVHKMAFGKTDGKKDKSKIVVNSQLTLSEIPLEAYDYIVNGKSAIEWIMERYAKSRPGESGITNDPNKWSTNPRYIVELLKQIVRVSCESVEIIKSLPPINENISNR